VIEHRFEAMNTSWAVVGHARSAAEAEAVVRDVEARLSRFRHDSALSVLNRDREARDPLLAEVLRRALALRDATGGAFDPAVGAAVIAAGYDRSFEQLPHLVRAGAGASDRPTIHLDGSRVTLDGVGLVDLGGIAKGFAVDRAAEGLGDTFLVDGGGDIRCGGRVWLVGVPGDRVVALQDAAVATSSALERRWRTEHGRAHHIVTPSTGAPAVGVSQAVAVAADAATADALATALVADAAAVLPGLPRLGAEALVSDAAWWMTPGMERHLR
jgi:thiamine biosynthesis lipoprotein